MSSGNRTYTGLLPRSNTPAIKGSGVVGDREADDGKRVSLREGNNWFRNGGYVSRYM